MKINKESFPQRCEICHQKDCFDEKTQDCSRCNPRNNKVDDISIKRELLSGIISCILVFIMIGFAFVGAAIGAILGFNLVLFPTINDDCGTGILAIILFYGSAKLFLAFFGLCFGVFVGLIPSTLFASFVGRYFHIPFFESV